MNGLLRGNGFEDFKWIKGKDIVVKQWVRFVCTFTCDTYGTNAVCPPNMPRIDECERFFKEYEDAVIVRIKMPADRSRPDAEVFKEIDENLLNMERELFLAGHYKAMAFPATICYMCDSCPDNRRYCNFKSKSRPTPEALGVDVFATVRNVGYPIEVLTDDSQVQNRYAIVMVE